MGSTSAPARVPVTAVAPRRAAAAAAGPSAGPVTAATVAGADVGVAGVAVGATAGAGGTVAARAAWAAVVTGAVVVAGVGLTSGPSEVGGTAVAPWPVEESASLVAPARGLRAPFACAVGVGRDGPRSFAAVSGLQVGCEVVAHAVAGRIGSARPGRPGGHARRRRLHRDGLGHRLPILDMTFWT